MKGRNCYILKQEELHILLIFVGVSELVWYISMGPFLEQKNNVIVRLGSKFWTSCWFIDKIYVHMLSIHHQGI